MEVTLNNGRSMPMAIVGTYKVAPDEMKQAVHEALKAGFTHFDTASLYQNEADLGEALSEAFETGLTSRDKVFITTKL